MILLVIVVKTEVRPDTDTSLVARLTMAVRDEEETLTPFPIERDPNRVADVPATDTFFPDRLFRETTDADPTKNWCVIDFSVEVTVVEATVMVWKNCWAPCWSEAETVVSVEPRMVKNFDTALDRMVEVVEVTETNLETTFDPRRVVAVDGTATTRPALLSREVADDEAVEKECEATLKREVAVVEGIARECATPFKNAVAVVAGTAMTCPTLFRSDVAVVAGTAMT